MNLDGFHISTQPLREVLGRRLAIPHIQRPYCWGVQEAETMFNDILAEKRQDKENAQGGDLPPSAGYFLNQITVQQSGATLREKLVDGQQRLISLSLLLFACYKQITSPETKAFIADLLYFSDGTEFQLRIQPLDEKLADGLRGIFFAKKWTHTGRKPKPVTNLESNFKRLRKLVGALTEDEREELALYVAQNVKVNVQKIVDFPTAVMIFERQQRGRGLETGDLVKAAMYRNSTGDDEQDQIAQAWESFEQTLPEDQRKRFFYHVASARYEKGFVAPQRAARWWDDFFKGEGRGAGVTVSAEIARLAGLYSLLNDARDPGQNALCEAHLRNISGFVGKKLGNHMAFLLAAADVADSDTRRRLYFGAERVLVVGRVAETTAAPLAHAQEDLSDWAYLIRECTATDDFAPIFDLIERWVEDHALAFRRNLRNLSLNVESNDAHRRIAQYFLGISEIELQRTSGNREPLSAFDMWNSGMTIDHILPQTPAPGTRGIADYEALVPLLGNLTPLKKTLNEAAGRLPFDEKAPFLGRDATALTTSIVRGLPFGKNSKTVAVQTALGLPEPPSIWNGAAIKARQDFHAEVASRHLLNV